MRIRLDKVIRSLSVANAAIKNTASPKYREGWFPAFSASGQDVWLPDYRFDQKGIVVSAVGARCGKAFRADGKWNICANTHALSVDEQIVDRDFCWYMLNNEDWWIKGGTAQPFVKVKDSLAREFVFPSLEEQKRIVHILSSTEGIIKLYQRQLRILDTLIKARFVEMFGDPKLNPHCYPVHQLSDHIQFLTSGSRGWAQYCVDDGAEWFITIKNVKDCHISTVDMQAINAPDNAEAKRTRVQEGDLLISITADLGRTGVVTKEIAEHGAFINQHLTCIRLDREILEPLYVAYFMESAAGKEQFISKNQSAVKAGLNFNSINTLRLLVPPIEVQRQFLRFVSQVDKSKVVVQRALDKAQLLFEGLMQQYFG